MAAFVYGGPTPARQAEPNTEWAKNWHHILYVLTSSNIKQLSKLFFAGIKM